MPESKLISYITSDFQTKSDLKIGEMEWENIMNAKFDKFKKAGAIRQTVTQIWNKDCLLYTSPSPRDATLSRMPSSA